MSRWNVVVKLRLLSSLSLLPLMTACKDVGTFPFEPVTGNPHRKPPVPSIAGTWKGATSVGTVMTLVLVQSHDTVSGNGSFVAPGGTTTFPIVSVAGVYGDDGGGTINLTLDMSGNRGEAVTLFVSASVTSTSMPGTLTGYGWTGQTITLTKQ